MEVQLDKVFHFWYLFTSRRQSNFCFLVCFPTRRRRKKKDADYEQIAVFGLFFFSTFFLTEGKTMATTITILALENSYYYLAVANN